MIRHWKKGEFMRLGGVLREYTYIYNSGYSYLTGMRRTWGYRWTKNLDIIVIYTSWPIIDRYPCPLGQSLNIWLQGAPTGGRGGKCKKSSLVSIFGIDDSGNRMVLSNFKISKYLMSYGYFELFSPEKHGFESLKNLPRSFKKAAFSLK